MASVHFTHKSTHRSRLIAYFWLLFALVSSAQANDQGDYRSILCELNLTQGNPGDRITDPSLVQKLNRSYNGFRYLGERYYRGNYGGVVTALVERNVSKNLHPVVERPRNYSATLEVVQENMPTDYLSYGIAAAMGYPRIYVNYSEIYLKTYYFLADEEELNGFFSYLSDRMGNTNLFPIRYVSVSDNMPAKEYLYGYAKRSVLPVASKGYLKIHDLSAHWAINFIDQYARHRSQEQVSLLLDFSEWIKVQPENQYWNEPSIMTKESQRIDFSNFNWVTSALKYDKIPTDKHLLEIYGYLNEFMGNGVSPKTYLTDLISKLSISREQKMHLYMALNRFCVTHSVISNVPTIRVEDVWQSMKDMRDYLETINHRVYSEHALPIFKNLKLIK